MNQKKSHLDEISRKQKDNKEIEIADMSLSLFFTFAELGSIIGFWGVGVIQDIERLSKLKANNPLHINLTVF